MNKIFYLITLFLLTTTFHFAQNKTIDSFSDKILLGGDLGLTFTYSDYKNPGVGLMLRGVGEYYFYENESHKIGLRGFAGFGRSTGSDDRYDPDAFSTRLYALALGGIYSVQLSNSISPYMFLGLKYLRFNPKDKDGNMLQGNADKEYDRDIFALSIEFGLRYRINENLFGYGSIVPLVTANDNIDDRASGKSKDLVFSLNFGLLYALDLAWGDDDLVIASEQLPSGIDETIEVVRETEEVTEIVDEIQTAGADEIVDKSNVVEESDIAVELESEEEISPTENVISEDEILPVEMITSDEEVESDEEIGEVGESELVEEYLVEKESDAETEMIPTESNIIEELALKLELGKVYFKFGETEIGRMEYVELDRLYRIIAEDKNTRWKIVGYTDNIEPIQIHQSLGIQRAYFVLRYFMEKGLDRNRFVVVVEGEDNPIADNSKEEGRAKNRRVEILKIN